MKLSYFFFCVLSLGIFQSCDPDDPVPENPEELITTLRLTWVPSGGGQTVVFLFHDIDGDGGTAPVITTSVLKAETTYQVHLELLNESVTPVGDITEEILEEDVAHQFFFLADGIQITHAYADLDADGNPVGLSNTIGTGMADSGTLSVILRHEPDKNASGVSTGDITNAGGETDIEVVFPVEVQ